MNTFTINQIPILISSITPTEVLSAYNGFTDYVKTIQVQYSFIYNDVTSSQISELSSVRMIVKLDIPTTKEPLSGFVDYDNLVKENFYPLAVQTALSSAEIFKTVNFVRIRTGLDVAPPKPPRVITGRPKPFN